MSLRTMLGRLLTVLTGDRRATHLATPDDAVAEEPVVEQPVVEQPPEPLLAVRTEPFEPGPIAEGTDIAFNLDQDTTLEEHDESQWALYTAWMERTTLRRADPAAPPGIGTGHWQGGIAERAQPWAPELRFFSTGGIIGGHGTMSGYNGAVLSGWPLFAHSERRRGVMLACRLDFFMGIQEIEAGFRAKEIDIEAYRARMEELYTTHCVDLWPLLWAGLAEADPAGLEPLVTLLVSWQGSPASGKVLHTQEDVDRWTSGSSTTTDAPLPAPVPAGVSPPEPVKQEPPSPEPHFERTDDGRLRGEGYVSTTSHLSGTLYRFTLDAGPESYTMDLADVASYHHVAY